MPVLLVLTLLVALVSLVLTGAMVVRDDSYYGVASLFVMMAAGFMAMTYGALNA